MTRMLTAADKRISIQRGTDDWEVVIRYSGHYWPAGRYSPEEWPSPYVAFAWLNGAAISNPRDVPDDVADEAVTVDNERLTNEETEP